MHVTQAELLSAAVTILSILFVFYTGLLVSQMRSAHSVTAPAVTGHPKFECAYRVQVNTLEQFVMFLPLLWLATAYFKTLPWLPAVFGLVWILGRIVYLRGYMAAPEKRGPGFGITVLGTAGLLILSIWGTVAAWIALGAV
ncbi:MAG TPA: MAPEG family protein [Rhizomicrobium sp.]